MDFVTMTQQLHGAIRGALGGRIAGFTPLRELLPVPIVVFPEREFEALAQGLRRVLSAQQKILRILRQAWSRDELLERLCVPPKARGLVDWDVLDAGADIIGRVDIVPLESGGYKFCELNIGPAIEGPQVHRHCESLLRALGTSTRSFEGGRSPYADLATMVAEHCRREGRERVVILDLDSYQTDGPLVYHELKRYFDAHCRGCEVHLVKDSQYRQQWLHGREGARTLVYRLFLEDEMQTEWSLLESIVDSGARLLNTFENYVLSSKAWFHIFLDESHRSELDEDELEAIERFVPMTHEIREDNLQHLLADKDGLVFKMVDSTEGRGVLIGREHTATRLRRRISPRVHEWTAQELLSARSPSFPQTHWSERVSQHVVLGLYHVEDRYSGLLFRANADSRVVNLASGGKIAWALRVTDAEYQGLLDCLARGPSV